MESRVGGEVRGARSRGCNDADAALLHSGLGASMRESRKSGVVTIVYVKDGKVYRVKARSAMMAGGSWTTKYIVRDLPAEQRKAYAQFYRSPCMMANVAVRNWRFLQKGHHGMPVVWRRGQLHGRAADGGVRRQSATISPDSPTVLTIKVIYSYPGMPTEEQGASRARLEMLGTPYARVRAADSRTVYGNVCRGGIRCEAGYCRDHSESLGTCLSQSAAWIFLWEKRAAGAQRDFAGAPFGRIAFANTDLAGSMDHRYSILEANRAVGQLCEQVLR